MGRFPSLSSRFCRQFLWFFIAIAGTVGTGCGWVYYKERQALQRSIRVDQQQELAQKQQFILSDIETAIADLKFLASESKLIQHAIIPPGERTPEEQAEHTRLELLLASFLREKSLYHQVSLLDRTGHEFLRVNRRNGEPQIVPLGKLQDKSDCTHFIYAQRLQRGEIYLSPFDLNLENGVVERPLVPVIRIATPLIDQDGEFQGIFILNYLGDHLLQHLDTQEHQSSVLRTIDLETASRHTHLVDGYGYWLNHHDQDQEWGLALPDRDRHSLWKTQPDLWQVLRRHTRGNWTSDTQVYTFLKMPVLSLVQQFNQNHPVKVSHHAANAYNWRLIMITPKALITQELSPLLRQLGLLLGSILLVSIPGLWSWLWALQQRQRTEKDLKRSREDVAFHQRQASILNERLSSQIRNSLDPQAVIETAISEVFHLLQSDRCTFVWLDFETHRWQVVYETKQDHLPPFLNQTSELPVLVSAFEQYERLQIDETATLGRLDLQKAFLERHHGAVLANRITTQSGTVGAILCSFTSAHAWSDVDVGLLDGVSEQVTIALNQAELYQMAQNNAKEAQNALAALKQAQSQLIRSEKMSSLGQLVAGVAHEINNPMNFIFGNVEYANGYVKDLLKLVQGYQDYLSPMPEELEELAEDLDWDFIHEDLPNVLQSMRVGAERIREIVKSLRTFSRLDEAERKAVDIHSGLESTLMILRSRLKATGDRPPITVIQDYDAVPEVECYPGLLNQVFMNLIANAIDALDSAVRDPQWQGEKPTLVIRTHWDTKTQELQVQIRDNGIGIEAGTLGKLFDPFFTTKAIGKGTGLGLSISYQIIVETHQGMLECESQPGQGAQFTLRLPQMSALPQPTDSPQLTQRSSTTRPSSPAAMV